MSKQGAPQPKRKRRVFLKALIVFLAAAVVARLCLGVYASYALRSQLTAIAARGDTVEWRELGTPPIPDERNSAEAYKQALKLLPLVSDNYGSQEGKLALDLREKLSHLLRDDEFRRSHGQVLREVLDACGESIRLGRIARPRDGCDWKTDFSAGVDKTVTQPLNDCGALAEALYLAALDCHDRGQDAEALQYLQDILAVSTAMSGPWLSAYEAAIVTESFVPDAIERFGSALTIGPSPAASREQVGALIERLLDDGPSRRAYLRAARGERCLMHDLLSRIRRGEEMDEMVARHVSGVTRFLFWGLICELDEAQFLEFQTAAIESPPESYRAAWSLLARPLNVRLAGRVLNPPELFSKDFYDSFYRQQFKAITLRRLAATALAITLYKADNGRMPDTLDQLAPRYIPAVPTDPFSPSGAAVLLRKDGWPPRVYSVWENETDDGGAFMVQSGPRAFDPRSPDLVFLLLDAGRTFKADHFEPRTRRVSWL